MWYVTYAMAEQGPRTRRACWDRGARRSWWLAFVAGLLVWWAWAFAQEGSLGPALTLWSEATLAVVCAWVMRRKEQEMDEERDAAIRATGVRDEDEALAVTREGHVLACRAPHSTRTEIIDKQGRIFTYAYHVDVDGGSVPVYLEEE